MSRYCECFASGVYCDGCNCANCCNNVENEIARHEAVEATLERNPNAFRPKIGSSPHAARDSRASHLKTSVPAASFPSIPVARAVNPAPSGFSKVSYRSLLADVVQPEDVKRLCKILVAVSGEAAKTFADGKAQEKLGEMEDAMESSLASSNGDRGEHQKEPDAQKASADECSSGIHADKTSMQGSVSDFADGQKGGRPMSPGTLALMCDEQDTMFMTSQGTGIPPRFPYKQNVSEVYAEQERCVLMEFRDYLHKLVNRGGIKESKYSSMAMKSEPSSHQELTVNGVDRAHLSNSEETSQTVEAFPTNSNKYPPVAQPIPGNDGDKRPRTENLDM
ncbi:putative protein tesmin/TSO1-like CXC 5 [Cocos nucifera]|uniref:CRC domain-containing protein n=1 Tax=Cocos nucifera TaxID=13894 RepID=A0A8K0N2M4_COCNU|nr:putative protein tesmin/TSO1-like CXC 5 [Cocos nucifera]